MVIYIIVALKKNDPRGACINYENESYQKCHKKYFLGYYRKNSFSHFAVYHKNRYDLVPGRRVFGLKQPFYFNTFCA